MSPERSTPGRRPSGFFQGRLGGLVVGDFSFRRSHLAPSPSECALASTNTPIPLNNTFSAVPGLATPATLGDPNGDVPLSDQSGFV